MAKINFLGGGNGVDLLLEYRIVELFDGYMVGLLNFLVDGWLYGCIVELIQEKIIIRP